jgi:hypothetical protein
MKPDLLFFPLLLFSIFISLAGIYYIQNIIFAKVYARNLTLGIRTPLLSDFWIGVVTALAIGFIRRGC